MGIELKQEIGIGEAAQILRLPVHEVRRRCDRGEVPHHRTPHGTRRFYRDQLISFLTMRRPTMSVQMIGDRVILDPGEFEAAINLLDPVVGHVRVYRGLVNRFGVVLAVGDLLCEAEWDLKKGRDLAAFYHWEIYRRTEDKRQDGDVFVLEFALGERKLLVRFVPEWVPHPWKVTEPPVRPERILPYEMRWASPKQVQGFLPDYLFGLPGKEEDPSWIEKRVAAIFDFNIVPAGDRFRVVDRVGQPGYVCTDSMTECAIIGFKIGFPMVDWNALGKDEAPVRKYAEALWQILSVSRVQIDSLPFPTVLTTLFEVEMGSADGASTVRTRVDTKVVGTIAHAEEPPRLSPSILIRDWQFGLGGHKLQPAIFVASSSQLSVDVSPHGCTPLPKPPGGVEIAIPLVIFGANRTVLGGFTKLR